MDAVWDFVEQLGELYRWIGGFQGAIVILLVLGVVPLLVGRPVLGPISRSAGRLKAPRRFMLSDVLWLLIQLQLSLGYCVRFVGIEHRVYFILVLGFLALATVAMWAGSVSFLSRAGVTVASRRVVFILFLLPATLAVMMAATFVVLVWSVTSLDFVSIEYRHALDELLVSMGTTRRMVFVGVLALPAAVWLLRQVSFWVLAAGPPTTRATTVPAVSA